MNMYYSRANKGLDNARRGGESCRQKRSTITSSKSRSKKKSSITSQQETRGTYLLLRMRRVTSRSIRSVNARLTGWTGSGRNPGSLGNAIERVQSAPSNDPVEIQYSRASLRNAEGGCGGSEKRIQTLEILGLMDELCSALWSTRRRENIRHDVVL
jgi:DNA-binding protein H-NS